MRDDIKEHLDGYQYKLAQRLDMDACPICQVFKRLGVTYKKFQASQSIPKKSDLHVAKSLNSTKNRKGPVVYLDEKGFTYDIAKNG